jgi:hypothetical protein
MTAAAPNVSTVITGRDGQIIELDEPATRLLNVTAPGCEHTGRMLAVFFGGGREAVVAAQRSAGPHPGPWIPATLQPRHRCSRYVSVSIRKLSPAYLEWTILPGSTIEQSRMAIARRLAR